VRPLSVGIADSYWPDTDVVIVNFEKLGRHGRGKERSARKELDQSWDIVIIDEAHRLAHSTSQRTRFATGIQSEYAVAATGTPQPDKLLICGRS